MGDRTAQKSVYCSIDRAKTACALLVIATHVAPLGFGQLQGPAWACNFALQNVLARIATPFFFVCSGFLLFRKQEPGRIDTGAVKRYVLRILRLYLIWSVIYLPFSVRQMLADERGMRHAIFNYVRNSLLLGSYRHLWYLNAVAFAVLLVTVLLCRKLRPEQILFVSFVFYLFGLLAQSWFGFLLPLKAASPQAWNALLTVKKVMVSTRNGLFEGFLFVSIGMNFAFGRFDRITEKQAALGLGVSLAGLFVEAFGLEMLGSIREYDMYLFLAFCCFFAFCLVKAKGSTGFWHPILRPLSTLVYCLHLLVFEAVALLGTRLAVMDSVLPYLLTAGFSFLLSALVIRLSGREQLHWMKRLYQ